MVNPAKTRQLNAFSLAALLISAHYGLGFVLGTAENALTLGTAGSLYAISIAVGTIALLGLAKFYWSEVEQIWTLLGRRYGKQVQILVGVMSWLSLIGIEAVQIIAGSFILKVLDAPLGPSAIALTLLFLSISLLPVEKAGWLFQVLLGLNVLVLFYGLGVLQGFEEYLRSPIDFFPSLAQLNPPNLIGISLSTILLVLIDMKYQQYVVRAKNTRNLYLGCLLAALGLFCLALLPSAVVIAAQHAGILPPELDGKEVIPFILAWIGGGTHNGLGIALVVTLIVPALGVGSSVLRMQTKTILDFGFIPVSNLNRFLIAGANAMLGLAIAFKGGSIVNLIVEFYSVYVATLIVPFCAYFIDRKQWYIFSELSVKLSLFISGLSAIAILGLTLFDPQLKAWEGKELGIMAIGMGFGILGLVLGQIISKSVSAIEVSEEI